MCESEYCTACGEYTGMVEDESSLLCTVCGSGTYCEACMQEGQVCPSCVKEAEDELERSGFAICNLTPDDVLLRLR